MWSLSSLRLKQKRGLCPRQGDPPPQVSSAQLSFCGLPESGNPPHPPPRADYAYRIVVDKGNLADLFATLAQSINYSKFKDCIARQPGQRPKLHAYHSFWASMLEVQHLAGGPGEG